MKISITYNTEKMGIEVVFNPELSDKVLIKYLIDLGFKKSKSKGVWYVKNNATYKTYVLKLQKAFEEGEAPNSIKIEPSYASSLTNIDHNKFSFVTIKIKEKEEKTIEYVVFEDLKKTATDIATRFAKSKYQDSLVSVSVSPRNFKVKARNAFNEGRIISTFKEVEKLENETFNSKKKVVEEFINNLLELENRTKEETETIIATFRLALEDILLLTNEVTFTEKVTHAIEEQKDWISDIKPEEVKKTFLELLLQNANALGYTHIPFLNDSGFSNKENTSIPIELPKVKSLRNEHGVYTQESAGDRYEKISIPIPATAKYEAYIHVVQDEENLFCFSTKTFKNFGDYSGGSSPITKENTRYKTKVEVLEYGLKEIISKITSEIEEYDSLMSDQKTKNKLLQKALKAVLKYANENGFEFQSLVEKTDKKSAESTRKHSIKKETNNVSLKVEENKEVAPKSNIEKQEVKQIELSQKNSESTIVSNKNEAQNTNFSSEESKIIRNKFISKGFVIPFVGREVFTSNKTITDLIFRSDVIQEKLNHKQDVEFITWIKILEKDLVSIENDKDEKPKNKKKHLKERIAVLKIESEELTTLVKKESKLFKEEFFRSILNQVKRLGYKVIDINSFEDFIFQHLYQDRIVENYKDEPLRTIVTILIEDYFNKVIKSKEAQQENLDYLDKVIAIMHDHFIKQNRLSKKKVEAVQKEAQVPNLGILWESIELSWLLWYKHLYKLPLPFEQRLAKMVDFWNRVQPTYAYSDSSKELYKQYSTPCPIGAMVAEYTGMNQADSIFEPSAGNGLLVLGADPSKTHVNEIDKSRRTSLEFQRFKKITHFNAAQPFNQTLDSSFDVVVTNPPFASWGDIKFDKERWVRKFFHNQIGVAHHMRLEHFMSGLALHTLKDTGKAAIIIMGHIYFGHDGYISKYKPFFNWLYRHYKVDDVINMNSYKLYNKQGAVAKTMLILINGRKNKPNGIAPTLQENPTLEVVVNSFPELWDRIASHSTPSLELNTIIHQLKIELGL